jgi:type 1 glutamine amidotransferase
MSANGKLLMSKTIRIIVTIAIAISFARTGTGLIAEADNDPVEPNANAVGRKVLYLTYSAGFKHEVLPLSEQILKQIGERSGAFEVTATQDCSVLSREGLRPYDAVVFYTTGELPISDAQKAAFLDFVRSGKGFVGIHSATDTFYKWPEYGELIGGYFDQHPWHQEVSINVEDQRNPATQHLGKTFKITDEIYQFRNFSRSRVHVLLSLDANSVDLNKPAVHRTDRDFALAWWRNYGKGRVFYTALGHRSEVWEDKRYQQHLLGALRWAIGL